MKKLLLLLLFSIFSFTSAFAQYEADVESIDSIIEALYISISGDAGEMCIRDRICTLYQPITNQNYMRIIAIEKEAPDLNTKDFIPYLRAEAKQGWELYKDGIIREMYFHAEKPEAVLILECENLKSAEEHLATLPLVEKGLISFELIPLKPYHGYERLFDKKNR